MANFVEIGAFAAVRNVTGYIASMNRVSRATASATTSISTSLRSLNQNTFTAIGAGINNLGNNINRLGGQISSVGTSMAALISFPVIAAFTGAAKAGVEYESTLKRVANLSNLNGRQVEFFRRKLLDMASALGQLPTALAESLFFAASAGITDTAKLLEIVTVSAKGTAIGLGETKDIVKAVTALMVAYGAENLTAAQAMEFLTQASKTATGEIELLAPAIGRALGQATALNIAPEEVLGFVAAYTRLGQSPAQAVTALNNAMTLFIRPSEKALNTLERFRFEGEQTGITAKRLRQALDEHGLAGALIALRQSMGDEFFQIFPQRGLLGALAVTDESQAATYLAIVDQIKNSSGELDKAFLNSAQGVEFRWKAMLAALQGAGIEFFNTMRPVIIEVVDQVIRLLDRLREIVANNPQLAQLAFRFGLVAAAAGPLLIILGQLTRSFGALVALTAVPFRLLGASIAAVTRALFALLAPIIAVGGRGIGLLTRGFGLLLRSGGLVIALFGKLGSQAVIFGKFLTDAALGVGRFGKALLGLNVLLPRIFAGTALFARTLGVAFAQFFLQSAAFIAANLDVLTFALRPWGRGLVFLGAQFAQLFSASFVGGAARTIGGGLAVLQGLTGRAFGAMSVVVSIFIKDFLAGLASVLLQGGIVFAILLTRAKLFGSQAIAVVAGTVQAFSLAFGAILLRARLAFAGIISAVRFLFPSVITVFSRMGRAVVAIAARLVAPFVLAGKQITFALTFVLRNAVSTSRAVIATVAGAVSSALATTLSGLRFFAGGIALIFRSTFAPVVTFVTQAAGSILATVVQMAASVLATITSTVTASMGAVATSLTTTLATTVTSAIGSLITVVGGAIASIATLGVSLIGLLAPIAAVGLALTAVIVFIGKIGPTIASFFGGVLSKARSFGKNLRGEMASHGQGAAKAFGDGLLSGLIYIVKVLRQWAATIRAYLQPGSPPKLLPDLTRWGQGAMQAYFAGWTQVDFSAFRDIGAQIREFLESAMHPDAGHDARIALIDQIGAVRAAIASAINELNRTGSVTKRSWEVVNAAIGGSIPEVQRYIRAMLNATQASERLAAAQKRIKEIQDNFAGPISRIDQALGKISGRFQEIADEVRIDELSKILRDPRIERDPRIREQVELELREITLKQQKLTLETERDKQLAIAQQELDAAEMANEIAQEELATSKAILDILIENNNLLKERLEAEKQEKEKAAKEEPIGDGGGPLGEIGFDDLPTPEDLTPPEGLGLGEFKPLGDLDKQLGELQAELGGLGTDLLSLGGIIQELVNDKLTSLQEKFTELQEHPLVQNVMGQFGDIVGDTVAAFDRFAPVLQGISEPASKLEKALLAIGVALGGVGGFLSGFFEGGGATLGQLLTDIDRVIQDMSGLRQELEGLAKGDSIFKFIGIVQRRVFALVKDLLRIPLNLLAGVGNSIVQAFIGIETGVFEAMGSLGDGAALQARKFFERISAWFWRLYERVVGKSIIPEMVDAILLELARLLGITAIQEFVTQAGNKFQELKDTILPKIIEIRDNASAYIATLVTNIQTKWSELLLFADTTWQGILAFVTNPSQAILDLYESHLKPFVDNVLKRFGEGSVDTEKIWLAIKGFVSDPVQSIFNLYQNKIVPFVDKMLEKFGFGKDETKLIWEAVLKFVKDPIEVIHGLYAKHIVPFVDSAVGKFEEMKGLVANVFDPITNAIGNLKNALVDLFNWTRDNTIHIKVDQPDSTVERSESPLVHALRRAREELELLDNIHARVNLTTAFVPANGAVTNNNNQQLSLNANISGNDIGAAQLEAIMRRLLGEMLS